VTFALLGSVDQVERWRRSLERAMPNLGEPDFTLRGPIDSFELAGYEFAPGELERQRGFYAAYTDAAGAQRAAVVPPNDAAPPGLPPGASVELRALVYVPVGGLTRALGVTGAEAAVRIDGQQTFTSATGDFTGPPDIQPLALGEGWHVVDASVRPDGAGAVAFEWLAAGQAPVAVAASELSALEDALGWLHTRSFGDQLAATRTLARFDYEPHVAPEGVVHATLLPRPAPEGGWESYDDAWSSVWHADAPVTYTVEVLSPGSEIDFVVDGTPLVPVQSYAAPDGSYTQQTYTLALTAGDHAVRLRFRLTRSPFLGGTIRVTDANQKEVQPDVRPY
jgi:hypothetical protein